MFFIKKQPLQHMVQPGDTVIYDDDRSDSELCDWHTCQPVHFHLNNSIIFLHLRLLWTTAIAYVVPPCANSPTLTRHLHRAFLHTDNQAEPLWPKWCPLEEVFITPWLHAGDWRHGRCLRHGGSGTGGAEGEGLYCLNQQRTAKSSRLKIAWGHCRLAIPASVPTH